MRHRGLLVAAATVLLSVELAMVACATKTYVIHPGSLSLFDSQAYDSLLTAQAAIDAAKGAYAQGQLPAGSRALLNDAIEAYNVAEASWHTYHDTAAAAASGDTSQLQAKLTTDLQQLTAAIAALETSIGKKPAPAVKVSFLDQSLNHKTHD